MIATHLDMKGGQYVTLADIRAKEERLRPVKVDATPISTRLRESNGYRDRVSALNLGVDLKDVDFKTLLTTAGSPGFAPSAEREPVVVGYPLRRTMIADLIRQDATRKSEIKYMRQVSETNAAAATAQGAAKPESAMDWDVVTSPLAKIAAFIPATQEEIDDVDGFVELIDNRLMQQVRVEEDDEILNGAGGTEITGLYNVSGVQTQAIGADTIEDAIFKATHLVRVNGLAEPNACLINPTDYQTVRLRKDVNDQYIWGPPSLPPPRYMWEMLLVISTAVVAGQPLVGDFGYAHISRKTTGRLNVSNEHDDYFIKNKVAIVAEVRTSFECYRPAAFAYVTA